MFNINWLGLLVSPMIFFTAGLNLGIQTQSSNILNIEKYLGTPTRDIPHLNILLRAQFMQFDAENPYTRWFLNRTACPLTIATYGAHGVDVAEPKLGNDRNSYVIVTNMAQLRVIAMRLMQRAGTFFFILVDKGFNPKELSDVLHLMWAKYRIFKNFILTSSGVLIYDPFEYVWNKGTYGQLVYYTGERDLERTLFSDMRGYPLRIQMFRSVYARPELNETTGKVKRVKGVDGEVVKMLQRRMNFTINFQDPDPDYFGERNANGTYNGAIGSILNNKIDLCMTGFFVKDYMVPEMDFTVAIYDDQLCIYVPKAKRIPQSILPVFSVGYDLWLGFILSAFACGLIWCVMRCINLWLAIKDVPRHISNQSLKCQVVRIFTDTWVVWVRANILRFPPFFSERIYIASLCLVSVIFGAIFESSLATVYIHPMFYKDINTLKELDESGLKVIYKYSSMADDLFFSETSPLFASLSKKLTYLNDLNADVTLDIAENGGKSSVTRYTSLMFESLHLILSKKIWMVPECPKYYTLSYVMPKDSPLKETVNKLLLRALNAGLIPKWISDLKTKVYIKIMKEHRFETSDIFKVLNIIDLQLPFYVVVFGSILSSLSLCIEIYLKSDGRHIRRIRRRRANGIKKPNLKN